MDAKVRRAALGLSPVLAVLAVLGLWQAVTTGGLFTADQFPTMTDTLAALASAVGTEAYWESVLATLQSWSLGLLIASVLALLVGSALAFNDFAFRSAAGVIEVFKAIPAIAILPLVIMVLGSTLEMKVFLVAFGVFWPLVIQVIYGVRSMDPTVLYTARALGIRGPRRFVSVTVPSAAPYIATGLRIASASALILSVVAELVGGAAGIGRNILRAQNGGTSAYPVMYAYIITAGLIGIVLTGAFFLLERRVMHWHESQRNRRANDRRVLR
ncbi:MULTISPECIES: ABC transporter permease [Pseudonocardia]|uniref:Nitrate ABC transporter, permease protein n=2 Tax=Pseudonocardia TaxID=1847 RepID=A0ABQ0S386_9PSEU|nr:MULTISPECIES: ABC transporter permease [Pseudonocardia]OSY35813.1 putative aliphatic sulfonates transport permease protein SsuC [Pseudonocardia autotrophica]TDN73107.1 ABC-type nitrate/sulfonate/bicarbonate transport system permease component [Pseudonocardia autotrophica]BBG03827.1 putative nitrate ABC transporter, permease protein [Pseudonocardia autotrophica]GEC27374.1 putative nitrate ABC transporter, permease protein [Pseudonocardia saturnea]